MQKRISSFKKIIRTRFGSSNKKNSSSGSWRRNQGIIDKDYDLCNQSGKCVTLSYGEFCGIERPRMY